MPERAPSPPRRCFYSRRVLLPEGLRPARIEVEAGRIVRVGPWDAPPRDETPSGTEVVDVGNAVLMPGVVDCHAHINEPGRTEWEGFETATAAAAKGGITTVVDMPLNSIPATTSLAALEEKARVAQGRCAVDYGFWGGVIPGNTPQLAPMAQAGALGFKAFLAPSGVDEFPHIDPTELAAALPKLAQLGLPLLAHAELELPNTPPWQDLRRYASYLASRPQSWEVEAIRLLLSLCRQHQARVHIVHLSAADALPLLREAKTHGLPFGAETCPHYLTFAAEEIPDAATHFKCAPPIREARNRERLWAALQEGLIDLVVSDHSPCTPTLKRLDTGDFEKAWGGIASLQFSLPAVWTGMQARGMGLPALAQKMCEAPARLAGLDARKGQLREGLDADFVVFAPEDSFCVEAQDVLHRHKLTPYAGRTLQGVVQETWLRGQRIYARGQAPLSGRGQRLFRTATHEEKR